MKELKQTVLLPTPKEDILDMDTPFLSTIQQYFIKDAWMAFEQKCKLNVGIVICNLHLKSIPFCFQYIQLLKQEWKCHICEVITTKEMKALKCKPSA